MSAPLDPPLATEPLSDGAPLTIGRWWFIWLSNLWTRVKACVAVVGTPINKTNQSAAIVTTTAYTVAQDGFYRVSSYLRITTVDGVSSSATVTITWREGGVTLTKTYAAVNGDTVTSWDAQTLPVRADSGTVITYAVAYASNTAAKMKYRIALIVELVS